MERGEPMAGGKGDGGVFPYNGNGIWRMSQEAV